MKKYLIILIISLISCSQPKDYIDTTYYNLSYEIIVPDSLKSKQEQFIKDIVKNTNFHITAGDYEDPEDVISEANYTFTKIYAVQTEGLTNLKFGTFTPFSKLDSNELKIFHKLKQEK